MRFVLCNCKHNSFAKACTILYCTVPVITMQRPEKLFVALLVFVLYYLTISKLCLFSRTFFYKVELNTHEKHFFVITNFEVEWVVLFNGGTDADK